MFTNVYSCSFMLPLGYMFLPLFTRVYLCLLVFSCFALFTRACLPMFISVYSCLLMFLPLFTLACLCVYRFLTRFYLCLLLYSCCALHIHECLPVYPFLFVFTYVYSCLLMFTTVNLCMFTYVYS